MNRRDFIGGVLALSGGAAFGDEYVATKAKLPPGSIGDPANVNFARHIFPLGHTIEDGESAALEDGEVYLPRRKVPVFHTTDVCVVGGGPAGFAPRRSGRTSAQSARTATTTSRRWIPRARST